MYHFYLFIYDGKSYKIPIYILDENWGYPVLTMETTIYNDEPRDFRTEIWCPSIFAMGQTSWTSKGGGACQYSQTPAWWIIHFCGVYGEGLLGVL
jgi:hypothetical protein